MKPKLYKIPFSPDSSFLYKQLNTNYINDPWHFHKEYELILVNKGKGTKFIGDNVSFFEEGNLTLIGSKIPHLYRNSHEQHDSYHVNSTDLTYLHFTDDFLGSHFFELPEMQAVNKVLKKSALALEIVGKTKEQVIKKLLAMNSQDPQYRLLSLLDILISLSKSEELKPLLSNSYTANVSGETHKINIIFDFILGNYTKEIYVQDIADQLNMSIAAFSRYFKKYTRKTFSDYVTEIRIGHACRLLMEDNHTISEICYQSGFDNLSNFYRHFKRLVGIIPKNYRKRFLNSHD
jgi:AraC-like DNA-binding protein